MRLLVCGGRDYADKAAVWRTLDQLRPAFVITGAAPGADHLAWRWADRRRVPNARYHAQWATHGRRAGPLRNQQMLDEGKPDAVLAFPGGIGTADMVRRARNAGVRVIHA